jgi:hypothetical protein
MEMVPWKNLGDSLIHVKHRTPAARAGASFQQS